MWENSEFKVEFSKCDMKEFERVMLSSGQCSFFMPMGFMGSENGEAICYDCSGFSPLSMYRIERTEDALYLLEQVLLILGKAVEYLITPANITLTTDTVFYSKETGEVKIAYVPVEGEAHHSISAAAEDGTLRWKRGISAENCTIYLLSQLLHPGYGQ